MAKSLNDLHPSAIPVFTEFLRRCQDALGFKMIVVDVLRDIEAQRRALANGTSKTLRSKHLPQPCCGKSHAIDVVPRHLALLKNWAPQHPDWLHVGLTAEALGLQWGGRWSGKWRRPDDHDYRIVDCPHIQWKPL